MSSPKIFNPAQKEFHSTQGIPCRILELGLIPYEKAFQIQKNIVAEVIAGKEDALIFCEHPCVLTMGRLASENNFLLPRLQIEAQGINILNIDRGGEVTLHAPGQLVAYPIFNLRRFGGDLRHFLFQLEQVAIDLLQEFDILPRRFLGQRGVWVGTEKIASIGIGVKRWISFHGMSINVNIDLSLFKMIRSCGLDVGMTSISQILKRDISMPEVKNKLLQSYSQNFSLKMKE